MKALKEKIEAEKGADYPAVGQKLIYAGKLVNLMKLDMEKNIIFHIYEELRNECCLEPVYQVEY